MGGKGAEEGRRGGLARSLRETGGRTGLKRDAGLSEEGMRVRDPGGRAARSGHGSGAAEMDIGDICL